MSIIPYIRKRYADRKAERAVRSALGAAVAGDEEWFTEALAKITDGKRALPTDGRELAFEIGSATLVSIHHDKIPSDIQLRRLAGEFADVEDWSGIDRRTALATLQALLPSPPSSPYEIELPMIIAVDAWLLSAFIPAEVEWTDFLDGILHHLDR